MRAARSSDDTSGRSQPCGDANQLAEDQTHGYHPQSHQPSAIEDMQQGSTVCRFLHISWNDGSSSRYITSRIAKAASAMYRLSNPLFRKHRNSIQTKINMYRVMVVSVLLYGFEAWATTLADRRSPAPKTCSTCAVKGASCVCSGSSTSATIASVNAPSNQLHHLFYDNPAYAGLDISTACHPPSLFEESMTSTQTSMAGRDLEAAPKLDGLIQSSTTSILLASTLLMLARWSLTDPSGRPLLADCQRSNPSKAFKSSKSSEEISRRMG